MIKCKIKSIFEIRSRKTVYVIIFSDRIEFDTSLSWFLGEIPTQSWFDIPKMIDPTTKMQHQNIFVLALKESKDRDKINVGDILQFQQI